jgi:hypothetical protein
VFYDTNLFDSPLIIRFTLNRIETILNDLLGGRGWWLVKGALVRGPFLFSHTIDKFYHQASGLVPHFFPFYFNAAGLITVPAVRFCHPENHAS